jgi:hypothetical protein
MARTFTPPTCRRISATSYLVPFCQVVEAPTSGFKLENCWRWLLGGWGRVA